MENHGFIATHGEYFGIFKICRDEVGEFSIRNGVVGDSHASHGHRSGFADTTCTNWVTTPVRRFANEYDSDETVPRKAANVCANGYD